MGNAINFQEEISKPLDASDIKTLEDGRKEVQRLRQMMLENEFSDEAQISKEFDVAILKSLEDGRTEVQRIRQLLRNNYLRFISDPLARIQNLISKDEMATAEVQEIAGLNTEDLSAKLEEMAMPNMSSHFKNFGISGSGLIFLAHMLMTGTSSNFGDPIVRSETNELKEWLFPILGLDHQVKEAVQEEEEGGPEAKIMRAPESWACSCSYKNPSSFSVCERCGNERPVETWICLCSQKNQVSNNVCEQCKSERPSAFEIRSNLVNSKYGDACSLGNPNIGQDNMVFISKEQFLSMQKFTKYEDCSGSHVKAMELNREDVILFVSHRWQDAENGSPDDVHNTHYSLVVKFLQSEVGRAVTHLWIDYSCVTQNQNDGTAAKTLLEMQNVQTALFISSIVLVLPRVEERKIFATPYTDLREYTKRGWCRFESMTALLGQSEIWIAFVAGSYTKVSFVQVEGGVKVGETLNLPERDSFNDISINRRYKSTVDRYLKKYDVNHQIQQNWQEADDPAFMAYKLGKILAQQWEMKREIFSLTVPEDCELAQKVGNLLVEFTQPPDKLLVSNLLANVGGFVMTGFKDICIQSEDEILELANKLDNDGVIDLTNKNLYSFDLQRILQHCIDDKDKSLVIGNNPLLGYNGMKVITDFSSAANITSVDIDAEKCQLDPRAVKLLCNCQHFKKLSLAGRILEEEATQALVANTNIMSLKLTGTGYGAEQLAALCANSSITSLNLYDNNAGDEGAKVLAANTILTDLNLGQNDVGDEGVKALAGNTTLAKLSICNNYCGDEGAKSLAENTNLTDLNLGDNDVGDEGVKALAENVVLTRLNLFNNNAGDQGASYLAANKTLTDLNLGQNNISAEGAKALAANSTLVHLNLEMNYMGDVGAKALAENSTITNLNLGSNKVGPQGAEALARNPSLLNLVLQTNNIGDLGAKALAGSPSLKELDLRSNQVGAQGAEAFSSNTTLTNLKFS